MREENLGGIKKITFIGLSGVTSLQEQLKIHEELEEYEICASIRDKIKEFQNEIKDFNKIMGDIKKR